MERYSPWQAGRQAAGLYILLLSLIYRKRLNVIGSMKSRRTQQPDQCCINVYIARREKRGGEIKEEGRGEGSHLSYWDQTLVREFPNRIGWGC